VTPSGRLLAVQGGAEGGIGALRYTWNWGDNSPEADGQSATHTYDADGTYTVRLVVSDRFSSSNATVMTVEVTSSETAEVLFESAATTGNAPFATDVRFFAAGAPPMMLVVDWKDGSTNTFTGYPAGGEVGEELTFRKTFTRAGTFNAEVTLVDNNGTQDTATLTFTVAMP